MSVDPEKSADFASVRSWGEYTASRLQGQKVEPFVIDALSYPMTMAYGMNMAGCDKTFEGLEELNVVLVGATEKAEQRIFTDSDYFEELNEFARFAKKIMIYMVGPEISMGRHLQSCVKNERLRGYFYKGRTLEFLKGNETRITCCRNGHRTQAR